MYREALLGTWLEMYIGEPGEWVPSTSFVDSKLTNEPAGQDARL